MHSQLHYLPLTLPFFSILVGVFLVLCLLLQVSALRFAYLRIGLGPGTACWCYWRHWSTATSTSRWLSFRNEKLFPGIKSTTLACIT
jgi:hypothetical protein